MENLVVKSPIPAYYLKDISVIPCASCDTLRPFGCKSPPIL
jgi:hypothetical protein